jgi:nanoRNase/pAp phosphatase (c-di-AMP/oligoRNAs hydrolase)
VHRALGTAVVFGDCVYAPVGDVPTPEFVSEVADYLVVLKGMRWSVATGRFDENLYFSIRTLTARKDAGRLLRKAMGRLGMAGGHRKMAGGVLPVSDLEPERREAAEAAVISKLLQALGANTTTSTPLLAFSE